MSYHSPPYLLLLPIAIEQKKLMAIAIISFLSGKFTTGFPSNTILFNF